MAVLSAVGFARAAAPIGPPPELLDAACSSGLLLQRSDEAPPAGAAADDDGGPIFGDSGLFGGSDDGKGDRKEQKPKPKPKTKLLRPRSEKDKAECPGKVADFYRRHGGEFNAVPAPAGLSAEQIESNIDRAYAASFGPAKGALMSDLKGEDISKKWDVVNRIFDGIGPKQPLDDAAFGLTVSKNLHDLVDQKAILPSDLGGKTPEELTAAPKTEPGPLPKAAPVASEPALQTPAEVLSPRARELYRPKPIPEAGASRWTPGYAPPAPGAYEPAPAPGQPAQRPQAASVWNRYAPDFAQDLAVKAGSWAADKIWGGGNPAVNTELPRDSHSPEQYRRVRYGNYGTEAMVKGIMATAADMAQIRSPTLLIGDISQKGGGSFRGHLSHKVGKDVDVFFITDSKGKFDVPWNLALAAAAVRNMNVTRIFVDTPLKNYMTQYLAQNKDLPAKEREAMAHALGKMSYWPGHDTHFHFRIDY